MASPPRIITSSLRGQRRRVRGRLGAQSETLQPPGHSVWATRRALPSPLAYGPAWGCSSLSRGHPPCPTLPRPRRSMPLPPLTCIAVGAPNWPSRLQRGLSNSPPGCHGGDDKAATLPGARGLWCPQDKDSVLSRPLPLPPWDSVSLMSTLPLLLLFAEPQ